MSQSPASMLQSPNPMKKKVLAALIAVVIGHVGVLFAVSHMKTPELKKIEKEPIKVRFLQIKEDAPPPPPPAEPVKPQVQPKPEPKVVKPAPVVKPKIIAEQTKQQNEKTKLKDDAAEKQKLENERLNQQRQNQERLDQQKREQAQRDQAQRDQAQKDQAERERKAREQAERDRLAREQAAAQSTPRKLQEGDIKWNRRPLIKEEEILKFLKSQDGSKIVNLEISSDSSGKVTQVKVLSSSGIVKLDEYVVKKTYSARFKPYKENGIAVPFAVKQDFKLSVSERR